MTSGNSAFKSFALQLQQPLKATSNQPAKIARRTDILLTCIPLNMAFF